MRAVVTGGAGFIGSNLVDLLIDRGATVDILDNLSTGRKQNLDDALALGGTLHHHDITDARATNDLLTWIKPDTVFHLAAQIDVRRAVSDPTFDAEVNVLGTIAVLRAAQKAGVRRVVFASTGGALYGVADEIPTCETARIKPMAPYGTSKAAAESYCSLFSRLHGMSTACLRLANVYGPRQDPLGEAGVVAIFCGAAKRENTVVPVYGDGSQTRDYVYVGDVVKAFVTAGESDFRGSVNIGTGRETTVNDLVRTLRLTPRFEPSRPGEVDRSCLAVDKAKRELGWKAGTGLAEGLPLTLAAAGGD